MLHKKICKNLRTGEVSAIVFVETLSVFFVPFSDHSSIKGLKLPPVSSSTKKEVEFVSKHSAVTKSALKEKRMFVFWIH